MAARAVRIVTEVAALDRAFDYSVPATMEHIAPGDRVRVDFNHRSVRGWVVDEVAPEDVILKPVAKWLGYGPPPSMLELLTWASWRWCGPLSRFLSAASPANLVTSLASPPPAAELAASVRRTALHVEPGVIEMAPTVDPLALILGAYDATRDEPGSLVVLVPTDAWATRLRGRLEQRGCAVAGADQWDRARAGWPVVVGARGTALAPVPRVCGAVIVDADDEAYRSGGSPTWDAATMLHERCRRDMAPLWCTSMLPSPALTGATVARKVEPIERGWPLVRVVDRRSSDPHDGVLAAETMRLAHRALDGDDPVAVVVVLQRLGTGRLWACRRCGELARCATCAQPEADVDGVLACPDAHEQRAHFCRSCGATNLRRVRVGVTTLARDVGAQLAQAVSEVTSASDLDAPLERVVVGTEAVWQRVRRCALVVFVDFDQYLLAPRASARRAAIVAMGKAGRLVGSRSEGRGEVVVQTRRGDDQVVRSLVLGSFDEVERDELETARLLGFAPYGAGAEISGDGATAFMDSLDRTGLRVFETPTGFVVRANDVATLSTALGAVARPAAKLRIAVE